VTTQVVYVGGSGRSGSTLLERMLARIPGSCSVGELVFIWERGLQRNDQCGCGARFRDCVFWSDVGESGFGGWSRVDVDEAVRLRATVDRHRNLDRISGLRPRGNLGPAIAAYSDLTDRLYRAVAKVADASVIIDSSKNASYALLLRDVASVDLRLVHLVRRSHGVAYSWSRRIRKPDVGDGSSFMSVHSSSWAVGLWMADNLVYEAVTRRMTWATRVRYEDLIADPGRELSRIGRELEIPGADQAFMSVEDASVDLLPNHALSGNPMRFQNGPVVLREDDEWRRSMSRPRRVLISAATWPLLMRYGYSVATGTHTHR
jgi:hypothetical protein